MTLQRALADLLLSLKVTVKGPGKTFYIHLSNTNLDQHDTPGMMEAGDSNFLYKVRVSLYNKNYSSIFNHQNVLEKCFMRIKCFIVDQNSVEFSVGSRTLRNDIGISITIITKTYEG